MRAVIQRVKRAEVRVGSEVVGRIGWGFVVLLGVGKNDTPAAAADLAAKTAALRVFEDAEGRMNRSIVEVGGQVLCVSQFTLYGDCRKGRRPSFDQAAPPEQARELYEYFVERARKSTVPVETGVFQAMMRVHLVNDGPVTILIDSETRTSKSDGHS